MNKFVSAMLIGLSLVVAQPVLAHGEKPRHGGVMSEAKDLNFELVAENGKAALYILDHGAPLPSGNVVGKLTVMNGSEKSEVDLQPAGENKLISTSDVKLSKGSKVIASVTLADKKNVGVRFSVK
jgi:hypothetical protein